MQPTLNIQKVKWALILMITTLVVLHLFTQYFAHILGYRRLLGLTAIFRLQSEQNLPSYFSGLLLAGAALLLVLIGMQIRARDGGGGGYWLSLGAVFAYLSVDEVTSIHESLDAVVAQVGVFDWLVYPWVVIGVLAVLVFSVVFFRFWLGLPPVTRRWFAIAAVVFVGGAIGFETVSGQYLNVGDEQFVYSVIVAAEEGSEMAGVAIFITALFRYAAIHLGGLGVRLRVHDPSQTMPGPAIAPKPKQLEPAD